MGFRTAESRGLGLEGEGSQGGCSPQHYSCLWAGGHPESSAGDALSPGA